MITPITILAQADAVVPAAPAAPAAPAEAQATTTTVQPTEQAPANEQQPQGSMAGSLITFLLIGVIFYCLLIRPQRKQQKEQKERQDSLKEGDKIVTIGGQYGIIREVLSDTVKVEIAPNVVVKFAKAAIAQNQSKGGKAAN